MRKEDPRPPQRDIGPIKEVGPEEIDAFERKAIELSKNAREERFGLDRLTSQYVQGGASIWIDIPKPGVYDSLSDQIAVTLNKFFFIGENGNYFYSNKRFTLNKKTREMEFNERIIEVDEAGRRIRSPMEQKEFEAIMNENFQPMTERIDLEKTLGSFIVTQENMSELMGVLNSLGQDDEVF